MIMTPVVRKLALVAHVASSVGWLGAVGAFKEVLAATGESAPELARPPRGPKELE